MPIPDTEEAITARLLEIGDEMAFSRAMHQADRWASEWSDLRAQLRVAREAREARAVVT